MNLSEILEFKLLSIGDFQLDVYHLIFILLILIITKIIVAILKRLFKRLESRKRLELGTGQAIFQIVKYFLWIIAIIIALDTLDVKITILLASSAALMVGLGLGLQQIFQDFVSGITLLIEGTLKVGDVVQTSDGEVGKVKQINMRTSKLESRSNIIMIVPNSNLINNRVINWSHLEKRTRFSVTVGVAYGSDVQLVKKVLLDCAKDHDKVFKNPPPFVRFTDFGNSSLDFELLFYTVETFRVEDIKSDIRFSIDAAFRINKIKIPFPQRDVHFYKEES